MNNVHNKTILIRVFALSIALGIAFGFVSAFLNHISAQGQKTSGTVNFFKRMADSKQ